MADHPKQSADDSSRSDAFHVQAVTSPATKRKKPKRNMYALAISVLASMTSVLLGYDGGVMSGATIYIKKDLKISDVQVEILVGTINLYSLIGAAAAGRTSDWLGRRYTIVFSAVIFFVGAVLMGCATNYSFLMAGRFVAGIGVGYGLMIAPVYAAEVSPASSRGFLSSFPEVFINFGVLLGYVSNYAFSRFPLKLGWRLMLGIGAIPSIFLGLMVMAMPESPRWLAMQNRLDKAEAVLHKTSDSPEEAQQRLSDIKEAAARHHHSVNGKGVWKELFVRPTRPVLHIVIAGLGIHFFQQSTGIDAVVMYSPRIYEKAGIKNDSEKLLATIAVGTSKTLFILVATFLVDRVGRRVLLLVSCAGMVASMTVLGAGLTVLRGGGGMTWAVGLCVAMTLSSVGFFSIGMGPIAWVYSSEVFPLRLRAQGCAMGVVVNRLMSGVVLMTFISLYEAVTIGGAFFIYAGIGVLGWVFFYALLPETRGRSLEDMEGLFGGFFRWREVGGEVEAASGGA